MAKGLRNVDYFAFIPKLPGVVAVVPNNGKYVREVESGIAFSDPLIDLLNTPTDRKCVLKIAE